MKSTLLLLHITIKSIAIIYVLVMASYLVLRLTLADRFLLGLLNSFVHLLFLPLLCALPVLILLRSRWSLLGITLLFVAALWYVPYFLPKTAAATAGMTLKVASFNVWGNNTHLSDIETWLRSTDADVILLQENPAPYAAEGRIRNLGDIYPHQFIQRRQYGNLILSRFPFVETADFDPTNPTGFSQQRVVIDVYGTAIAIYNIHLSMPVYPWKTASLPFPVRMALGYNDAVRNTEIHALLTLLQSESLPFIVAGDFNMSDQSTTYLQVAAVMGDTFREAGIGLGASWPRPVSDLDVIPRWLPPLIRIDYVWHSAHWTAIEAEQGPYLGSDHLAVIGVVALAN